MSTFGSALPVVVCGGGPVGLFCALRLSRAGIPCILLEKEPAILQTPRAIAYSPPTVTVLDEAGILEDCLRVGQAQTLGCFRQPGPGGKVYAINDWDKTKDINKYPYSLMIGQHDLGGIIQQHCAQYSTTQLLFNHEIVGVSQTADVVKLQVKRVLDGSTFELEASYLVGADGGRSFVRKAIGQHLHGFSYENEVFVAANIINFPFEKYPGYLTRNFVVSDKDWAVIARTGREDKPWRVAYGEEPGLDPAELRRRAPGRIRAMLPGPDPFDIVQIQPYKVHQRSAETYRVGRVLLAGDAAHLNNPIGGYGLTTGITDAACLTDALVARVGGKATDAILDAYSNARKAVFDTVSNPVSQEMKKIIQSTPEEVARLEETFFKEMNEDEGFAVDGLMGSYRLLTRLDLS